MQTFRFAPPFPPNTHNSLNIKGFQSNQALPHSIRLVLCPIEYASILLELGLLRENEGKYSFNEISIEQVNPLIILFALVHIAGEDKTVSFDKLQELSLIFCIPTSSFLMVVRSLSEQYPKEISYTDNSGIRNVQFLQKLNILEVLNRYYNNDEI